MQDAQPHKLHEQRAEHSVRLFCHVEIKQQHQQRQTTTMSIRVAQRLTDNNYFKTKFLIIWDQYVKRIHWNSQFGETCKHACTHNQTYKTCKHVHTIKMAKRVNTQTQSNLQIETQNKALHASVRHNTPKNILMRFMITTPRHTHTPSTNKYITGKCKLLCRAHSTILSQVIWYVYAVFKSGKWLFIYFRLLL